MILIASTESMSDLAQAVGPTFFDAAIKGALVLGLAGLIAACMRRCSAAARHLVWLLGVTGSLLLPVLSWVLPSWQVLPSWMVLSQRATPGVTAARPADALAVNRDTLGSAFSAQEPRRPLTLTLPSDPTGNARQTGEGVQELRGQEISTAFQSRSDPTVIPRRVVLVESSATGSRGWNLGVTLFWSGTVIALTPTILGIISLWLLERRSRPEMAAGWQTLLRRSMEALRLRRSVVLLKASHRRMPMTWGIIRPKLLLPEDAEEWTGERRRVVLLHELAHVKRWDYLTGLITHLACAVYWFNPLIWMAARAMANERERACDDLVISQGTKAVDYAEQILQIASGLPTDGFAAWSGIPMARPSKLEGRLVAILDHNRDRAPLTRLTVVGALGLFALMIVPLATMKASGNPASKTLAQIAKPEIRGQKPDGENQKPDWGEPVEGVTVRLRVDKAQWGTNESPVIWADVYNGGDTAWYIGLWHQKFGRLELDGVWHRWTGAGLGAYGPFAPGERTNGIAISLYEKWGWAYETNMLFRQRLAPGRHVIRFEVHGDQKEDGSYKTTGRVIRAVSNPIEIEMLPGRIEIKSRDGGFDPTNGPPVRKSGAFATPPTGAESDRVTAAATTTTTNPVAAVPDATWGEVVEGLSIRLRVDKAFWVYPDRLSLIVDTRNQGTETLAVAQTPQAGEIEMDGVWYSWWNPVYATSKPLEAGRELGSMRVTPDNLWRSGRKLLVAMVGKHTFRYAVTAHRDEQNRGETIRAVSNPVEIEIQVPTRTASRTSSLPDNSKMEFNGRAIDNETGEPIPVFALQFGGPNPNKPDEIAWRPIFGSGVKTTDGSFRMGSGGSSTSLARVVAAGYVPRLVTPVPFVSDARMDSRIVRMKRGGELRGVVIDHAGHPVVGSLVYVVATEGLALTDGKPGGGILAYGMWPEFFGGTGSTDGAGRFAVRGSDEPGQKIVVTSPDGQMVMVVSNVVAGQPVTVTLPRPAIMTLRYDIGDDAPDAQLRLELTTGGFGSDFIFVNFSSGLEPKLANGGQVVLTNLVPGTYALSRTKMLTGGGDFGRAIPYEVRTVVVEPGRTQRMDFVRTSGFSVSGRVTGLSGLGLSGAYVYVRSMEATIDPDDRDNFRLPLFDAMTCDKDGNFRTARLEPGDYAIVTHAYIPQTQQEQFRTGRHVPAYIGMAKVTIRADSAPGPLKLELRPSAQFGAAKP